MSPAEIHSFVDGFAIEHLGKSNEINLPGLIVVPGDYPVSIPFVVKASMPRIQRLNNIKDNVAVDVLFAMIDNFDIFKHYADTDLLLDLVRAGYLFDLERRVFYHHKDVDKATWSDRTAFRTAVDRNRLLTAEQDKAADASAVEITGFTVSCQHYGFGVTRYIVEVQTNALSDSDKMDEKKVQAVAEQLNKQLVKNLLK